MFRTFIIRIPSAQLATLTYSVNYENKEEDGIWVKGVETVMMALEKRGDNVEDCSLCNLAD